VTGLARPGLGRRRPNPAQAVDRRQTVTRWYTQAAIGHYPCSVTSHLCPRL